MIIGINTFAQQGKSYLQIADSLYAKQDWKNARQNYLKYINDTSTNPIAWNRLGYSNHNLGFYDEALKDYQKALDNKPSPPVRGVALERMARVYSLLNKPDVASNWLLKACATGYNILPDLDTLEDFKNVRQAANYSDIKKKVYESVYPCAAELHSHDFDFWIGEWEVYQTGTKFHVGHSVVQSIAGECAILENWTSTQAQTGKSINYYNPSTSKWEQDWIGSGGGPQRYLNGEYKDNIMHFTYETTNAKGQKVTGNFKFYNIDKNTVRQYQDVNNDDGKTITVSYDFTYVRK
jgi:tetratricopeptide (TPR) repeat protein